MSREERWQLSGNAPELYERYLKLMMEPWVRRLVDVAALRPAESVLDVACGTGFVARLASDRVGMDGRVVGIDLNGSMIEAARAVSTTNAGNTIEWRTGDAAALPFANAAFDVVLCQQGVQFFPDRLQALREMRRVLHRGGRLAFTVWGAITDFPYSAALADALERHVSADAGAMMRAAYALHDAEELHRLVASASFQNVRVHPTVEMTRLPLPAEFVPGHLAALPIAQEIARLAADRRAAIVGDVTKALRAYMSPDRMTVPAGVNVVTADAYSNSTLHGTGARVARPGR
jgi:ubiquinone/menaquinone biosynthesis C-methylase UbiE